MGYTKTSFRKGHQFSENILRKISLSNKKRWEEEDFRKEQLEKLKGVWKKNNGRICSEETKKKISVSNKGRKWSKKQKENVKGENHHRWKGNDVGYGALHLWIKRRLKKPLCCDNCRKKKDLDLANISGKYKRDLNDWKWLCRKCHIYSDNRINILRENNKRKSLRNIQNKYGENANEMFI